MKAIVGVDPEQPSLAITSLLGRLRFPHLRAICASYAVPPMMPPVGWVYSSQAIYSRVVAAQHETAQRATQTASMELCHYGVACDKTFETGEPAYHLALAAVQEDADLIAIGSHGHGPLESFLLGSVGRSLALDCPRSLLIAKGNVAREGELRALFGFDGSTFGERCVDELIRLRPEGIAQIDLLIVDATDSSSSPAVELLGETARGLEDGRRRQLLTEHAEVAATRLRTAGYGVHTVCATGRVNEVIRHHMAMRKLDLAIVGSKGHGWLERTLFGSVALSMAVTETAPVLILHPKVALQKALAEERETARAVTA